MVKVPLSNSFLERRDAHRKFSESPGLAPPWRHALVSGSHLDPKMTGNSGSEAVRPEKRRAWAWELLFRLWLKSIGWDMSDSGRDNLRSHFVPRLRHAPKWRRAWFLQVVFLANEEELTGKTFTTSLNTTNPNTYMKFIFLRTSPLRIQHGPDSKSKRENLSDHGQSPKHPSPRELSVSIRSATACV